MSVGVTAGVGVTAHVTWHEFETRGKAFAMMQAAGMDYVRSDFQYWRCRPKKPGEAWSFGMYDQVVDEAGKRDITVLPILMYQSNWGREEFGRHEGEWTTFVRETARHFKGRIPVYEVCNEPNLHSFRNNPNPVNYLAALKAAYRAIKEEDPSARVMISGFAVLDADKLDAVVYPFDESFPLDTIKPVARFVKRGGVLVDFGGCPMWAPNRKGVIVEKTPDGKSIRGLVREQLRIDVIWPCPANGLAANARTFVTEAGMKAGLKPDPNGFSCFRFFDRTKLKDGDEFVPLTTVKGKNGHDVAGACVYRFNSDLKGAIALAGCGQDRGGTTEEEQARYLQQAIDISKSFGVERFFLYEFQAPEKDPYYSEDHFGIVHKDFTPKAAYEVLRKR